MSASSCSTNELMARKSLFETFDPLTKVDPLISAFREAILRARTLRRVVFPEPLDSPSAVDIVICEIGLGFTLGPSGQELHLFADVRGEILRLIIDRLTGMNNSACIVKDSLVLLGLSVTYCD
jgi:hypothetical protein